MSRYIKMSWDCIYCGKNGIAGDIKHCPGCGHPCGSNIKFYIPQIKEYVDTTVVPNEPDWQCDYCLSYNCCDYEYCGNCGASKDGTKNYFGENVLAEFDEPNVTNSSAVGVVQREHITEGLATYRHSAFNDKLRVTEKLCSNDLWKQILFVISIVAVIAGIVWLFVPKEKELTVEGVSWERSATIYRYETVHESDWNLPTSARLRYTTSEIRSYDTVQDGYTTEEYTENVIDHYDTKVSYRDLGNGYAEEVVHKEPVYKTVTKTRQVPKYKEVPVYDTKYHYDIDKYVYNRVVKVQSADKTPYWPANLPVEQVKPKIGAERVEYRQETYSIMARQKGKDVQAYTMNYQQWCDINVGDTVRCKVYINNAIDTHL